ncbi:SETMR methyltransferase, partial [Acromyrmex insinuator]
MNEFKRGRTSTCNASRLGRPIETATPEIINKVHDIVLTDRRVKVRELVEATDISHGTVISILTNNWTISKQCLNVIHYFTPETKEQSKQWISPSEPASKKVKTVRVHTCPAPMTKFNEFRYELLPHPAYSPDLAPCNYFLFPNLKKWFRGKRFTTREQLIAETDTYFEGLDKSYYSDGLKKLKNRWVKCIELKEDYVEK